MSPRLHFNQRQFSIKLQNFLRRHWLDLIVIGVIITVISSMLWNRSQRQTQWILVQVKVLQEEWWWQGVSPEYWYAQNLKVGTMGQNSFGETVAEVVKTEITDVGLARNQVQVWAKVKVSYDAQKDHYIFGFQPLQVGKGLELNFGSQQVKGVMVAIDQELPQTVERIVEIKLFQLDPKAAEALRVGLEKKTSAGEVVATITKLDISQTIRSEFSDIRGRMIQVSDPNYVQINADIKMRLIQDGDKYVTLDGQAVKIGGETNIQFPQVVLTRAVILDIKPILPQ